MEIHTDWHHYALRSSLDGHLFVEWPFKGRNLRTIRNWHTEVYVLWIRKVSNRTVQAGTKIVRIDATKACVGSICTAPLIFNPCCFTPGTNSIGGWTFRSREKSLYLPGIRTPAHTARKLRKYSDYAITASTVTYGATAICLPHVLEYVSIPTRKHNDKLGRSQRPRGLRRTTAAERLLGSWLRIPPRARMFVLYSVCVVR
jgi:hypothetical protein